MTQQSKLSMLAGYWRKKNNNVTIIDRTSEIDSEITQENEEITEIVEEVMENVIETQSEEQTEEEEEEKEKEKENKNQTEEDQTDENQQESAEESEDEEEEELDVNLEDLSEDEKNIFDAISEVYKKSWKKNIDELSQIKGFDKVMLAVENQFQKHYESTRDLQEKNKELEDQIQSLKKEQLEQKKEWELKQIETQRYKLDEDDEYILDLKKRLSKDASDETTKRKLRDEYLRAIATVDPEFDMFEYRKRIEAKKTSGIENLSWSNRSTAPLLSEDKQDRPLWFIKRR